MTRFGLSKSKITMFEQCPKRLWLSVHRRDFGPYDESAEAHFATGHEVGDIACSLLPNGIMVDADPDLDAALERTKALLKLRPRRPIFEATLEHDGVLVRVDILEPLPGGGWKMAEVKSSGSAKPYHHADLATQLWVARNCGLKIRSACTRHIDTSFVLKKVGDYRGLFHDTELLDALRELVANRGALVSDARASLSGGQPQVDCGEHCSSPFICEFTDYCRLTLPPPPEWTVDVLCNGGAKKWREQGIENLFDVDPVLLTNPIHQRIYSATKTGAVYHDAKTAIAVMRKWAFPRSWLDFETIAFAVPRWVGTRPYQQIPFQYSVHIEDRDGAIEHKEFLCLERQDPRRACAEALVRDIPSKGAVIAYNASFERGQLTGLAADFPDLAPKLRRIARRVVDLLPVARANWYHRDQRGSWSIKSVLPTVSDLDYSTLQVKDGGNAQEAYLRAICPDCLDDQRSVLGQALRAYCERDTWAMIEVARALNRKAAVTSTGPA